MEELIVGKTLMMLYFIGGLAGLAISLTYGGSLARKYYLRCRLTGSNRKKESYQIKRIWFFAASFLVCALWHVGWNLNIYGAFLTEDERATFNATGFFTGLAILITFWTTIAMFFGCKENFKKNRGLKQELESRLDEEEDEETEEKGKKESVKDDGRGEDNSI